MEYVNKQWHIHVMEYRMIHNCPNQHWKILETVSSEKAREGYILCDLIT